MGYDARRAVWSRANGPLTSSTTWRLLLPDAAEVSARSLLGNAGG